MYMKEGDYRLVTRAENVAILSNSETLLEVAVTANKDGKLSIFRLGLAVSIFPR